MVSVGRAIRPHEEETMVDQQAFDELVAIMDRLARGDLAVAVRLYERFRGPIAAAVRRVVTERGRRLGPDEIEGMVVEVCFELARVAASWSPAGGALPWVWARHRVANVVDRELGQWTEPLDERRLQQLDETPAPAADAGRGSGDPDEGGDGGDVAVWPAFQRMAAEHHGARLLHDALELSGISARDQELWLEYVCEKAVGNPSPATTLSPVFAMKESTVRQAARRVRQRVRRLATTDERYAPLIALPVLA
jgi:hypothetical protein